jgi:hypothetical protein
MGSEPPAFLIPNSSFLIISCVEDCFVLGLARPPFEGSGVWLAIEGYSSDGANDRSSAADRIVIDARLRPR